MLWIHGTEDNQKKKKKIVHNIFEIVYFKVKIINTNKKVRLIPD